MTETDTALIARAERALNAPTVESHGPIKIVSAALAGTVEGITFQTSLRSAHQVMALRDAAGPGSMSFSGPEGSFSVDVTLFPGFSYYVEINGDTNTADRPLLWTSMTQQMGAARGVATRDSETGHWYFVTPPADDRSTGEIHIYCEVDEGNTDQGFGMEWVSLLAVKLAGNAGDG